MRGSMSAILNLHERIENKLFLDRARKDSNFKHPHIFATLFQIEKCWKHVSDVDITQGAISPFARPPFLRRLKVAVPSRRL